LVCEIYESDFSNGLVKYIKVISAIVFVKKMKVI
jgi:hypothetical protein